MTTRPKFPDGELSLLLCEQLGWRGGLALDGAPLPARGIATGEKLRLTADPRGPLALTSADGSLGRLRLPRGMALDANLTLHLLTERPCDSGTDTAIWRFDAARQRFERLPEVGGCVPNDDSLPDARQFHAGSAVAILGKALYVADPVSARVQVFDLTTLALRYVWHTPRQSGRSDSERWQPVDVAASAQQVYILDQAHGRVYRHQPSSDALDLLIDLPNERGGAWTRIAVDRDERLYPYDAANAVLEIFAYDEDDGWCPVGTADDAGDVRERFDPPAITVEQRPDATRWFALPACLRRSAGRHLPGATKPPVGETAIRRTRTTCISTSPPPGRSRSRPNSASGLPATSAAANGSPRCSTASFTTASGTDWCWRSTACRPARASPCGRMPAPTSSRTN
ncbi:MAG: hypothetical protein U0521_22535 [Anaerolineae bacterium]